MSDNHTRVRYSRESRKDRTPKNTLVTQRRDGTVYFGIARCNRAAGDTFKRQGPNGGSTIAQVRLQLSLEDDVASLVNRGNVWIHPKGLRGQVRVENVKEMIEFFNNVDAWCYERGVASHRTPRLEAV